VAPRSATALLGLVEALLQPRSVGDLEHGDELRLVVTDNGDGRAIAHPGLDVLEVEIARQIRHREVEEPLAEVAR
jgi:hypothetical protein